MRISERGSRMRSRRLLVVGSRISVTGGSSLDANYRHCIPAFILVPCFAGNYILYENAETRLYAIARTVAGQSQVEAGA